MKKLRAPGQNQRATMSDSEGLAFSALEFIKEGRNGFSRREEQPH